MGKYYALIIGVDAYSGAWSALDNAVRNARAVKELLASKYRFDNIKTQISKPTLPVSSPITRYLFLMPVLVAIYLEGRPCRSHLRSQSAIIKKFTS